MPRKQLCDFVFTLVTETEKAILIDDAGARHWLPKSQIEYTPQDNGLVEVTMPEWLAIEKELI